MKEMKKELVEKEIVNLVKEVIPEKEALKLKKQQQQDEDKIEELVHQNYSKNFFVDVNPIEDVVLIMGMNPGGGKKIIPKEQLECYGFACVDENAIQDEDENELFQLLKNKYIWQNYHRPNYQLFEKIEGKLFWTCKDEKELEKELEKILEFEKVSKQKHEKYKQALKSLYEKEKNKKGPVVVFSDLLYYCDSNQNNIKKIIEQSKETRKEALYKNIRQIVTYFIEFYHPKLMVVTNAYASDLINIAFKGEINKDIDTLLYEKDDIKTQIIFSGMVSGRRPLDKYSLIRLKRDVTQKYLELKKENK